jgi:broad specificity phosphatase PhoE
MDCGFESPLLPIGIHNAKNLYSQMNFMNIDTIYSSPFLRTIQTADFYSKIKNIPINIDYSLAEFLLPIDKYRMKSIYNYEIPNSWKNNFIMKTDNMLLDKYNINEEINDCINRLYNFLTNIIEEHKYTKKNILLVTHMSIVNVILGLMENNINIETFNMDKPYPMGLITELNILNKNNI